MEGKRRNLSVVKYMLLAAVLILAIRYFDVLLGGVSKLWEIVFPLGLGAGIAYVLNIVMKKLEKVYFPRSEKPFIKKARRPVCILLSILLILLVVQMVLLLVVPQLIRAAMVLGQNIPAMAERAIDWLAANGVSSEQAADSLRELEIDWEGLGKNVWNYMSTGLGGVLNSTVSFVSSAFGMVVNLVIALIFAVYILCSKEKLAGQFKRIVRAYGKPEWIAKGSRVLATMNETFTSFIVGQATEAVILGSLCAVGMLLLRFPYALTVGAFVGATALIPVVGAYLGAVVGGFMIFTQDPLKALLFLVFIVVLQQLEGNLIYPKVVGGSIGLPGIWVLAAVTVGGGLLGVGGMLLGVPLAATAYKLLAQDVSARSTAKKE